MQKIVSRKDARSAKAMSYYTGKVCINGHLCKRWVFNGACWECQKISCRRSYLKNKKRDNERKKRWLKANPETRKEQGRRYREKHPEAVNACYHRRRARKANAIGSFSAIEIKNLFVKQSEKCAFCYKKITLKNLHRDHIMPLSRGGANWISNIQLLCQRCNLSKSDKDPIHYAQENGRLL